MMTPSVTAPGLIADIGGTNARFALVDPDGLKTVQPLVLACADFPGPAEAALAYLERVMPTKTPDRAAFDVACPVIGDQISLTNHPWSFSIRDVQDRLRLSSLKVVNDFTAVALSVPLLTDADQVTVGGGDPVEDTPIAVLGAGTGLGVSALIPHSGRWEALATEGGHVTMAAATEREAAVLAWLRGRFGHVSAERVLSGPGIVNLHAALRGLAGQTEEEDITPSEVSRRALSGDPLEREVLDMFFAMLGTIAGNLAISLGAMGGVVIAGGIVPKLLPTFLASGFYPRFIDKGRFRSYLEKIPVKVTIHPYPAFLGLTGLVTQ